MSHNYFDIFDQQGNKIPGWSFQGRLSEAILYGLSLNLSAVQFLSNLLILTL